MKLSWDYIRAMIRYVWFICPSSNGSAVVRVHDRYTGVKTYYLICFN